MSTPKRNIINKNINMNPMNPMKLNLKPVKLLNPIKLNLQQMLLELLMHIMTTLKITTMISMMKMTRVQWGWEEGLSTGK